MSHDISRRDLIGGATALLAGAGALGSPAKAGVAAFRSKGKTHNQFFVGFINEDWLSFRSENWRWLVSDDGSESVALRQPYMGRWVGLVDLVHGTRVMALRPKRGEGDNSHFAVRILETFAPSSWEAKSDHKLAQETARIKSEWVAAQVISAHRDDRPVPVLCLLERQYANRRIYKLPPVGALRDAKRGEFVDVRIGKTWEGWQAFEARQRTRRLDDA